VIHDPYSPYIAFTVIYRDTPTPECPTARVDKW
jgi:hypothetical protein